MIMRLKELRQGMGLTQAELAAQVGVNQNTLSIWESEHALPRTRDLPRLAQVLGCAIGELFADDAEADAEAPDPSI